MKKDEVPQDNSRTYGGHKKLLYATNEDGGLEGVQSFGWEVETYATVSAVEALEAQRDAALARGRAGITSPLEYHMFAKRMDMATLTSATGYGAWRVKRHLKPHIFNKLTDAKLKPYCEAMDILPEELRRLPVQEPGESPEVPAESKA